MTLAVIVPVKGLGAGKGRLAEALSVADRARLNQTFLERTLAVVAGLSVAAARLVVSPDEAALAIARSHGAVALAEASPGLNGALEDAARHAATLRTNALLVVSVDLPRLQVADLEAMIRGEGVTIAPDRTGTGTNALYLARSNLIRFSYGTGSFAAHVAAARVAGVELRVIRRPNLAFDIDTPEDYAEWTAAHGSP